jgi:hypothetical protein
MDFGVDYQFKIYWRGGKEPIKTIELSDSLHYGLDEDDRERFGEFEGYLHELVK